MENSVPKIEFIAETNLPTTHGSLRVRAYRNTATGHEPLAIISGNLQITPVPVRVHDACFTSEVLGSLKCDCREQLDAAIQYIQVHQGVVIYLHQEGRGIGLANKIAAYHLQEQGLDTVDANRALHLPDDAREYQDAAAILADLQIHNIALLTNNPMKLERLRQHNLEVIERIPIQVPSPTESHGYLQTKFHRMGHLLDPDKL